MTANFGSERLRAQGVGFRPDEPLMASARIRDVVQNELKRHLLPEFLNRLDEILVFEPLRPEHMHAIAEKLLIRERLVLVGQGRDLRWSEEVVALLAKDGYSKMEGARPVRTLVQQRIEDEISQQVLDGRITEGQTVHLEVIDGSIVIRGEDPPPAEPAPADEEPALALV